MYAAKEAGKNCYRVFAPEMHVAVPASQASTSAAGRASS